MISLIRKMAAVGSKMLSLYHVANKLEKRERTSQMVKSRSTSPYSPITDP